MKFLSRFRRPARRERRRAKSPARRINRAPRVEPLEDRRLLAVVFDNGPADAAQSIWSATHPGYTTLDDFTLAEATTLEAIEYEAFHGRRSDYIRTRLSIFDSVAGTRVVPDFTGSAELTRNGLRSSNALAPLGFTHHLDGLSISLDAGRYFVGISLENAPASVTTIGSGPGSEETVGPGLFQRLPHQVWVLRADHHMSFQMIGVDLPPEAHDDAVSTPEDTAVLIDVAANDAHATGALDVTSVVATAGPNNGSLINLGDGRFTYLPDADFHGTDAFTYEIADTSGQTDTAVVDIEITPVVDAASDFHSLDEDTSAQLDPLVNASFADPGAFVSHVTDGDHGTVLIEDDGTVTYTPHRDYYGSDSFTYTVTSGSNGSEAIQETAAVQVTVDAVNDPPSFQMGAGQRVDEDAALQAVLGWAKSISPGPDNESSQHVWFDVHSDNESLFADQPAISDDGVLTYTPAPNAFGTAHVTVRAVDDGGTSAGGRDSSPPQTFTITVNPIIDAEIDVKPGDDPNVINLRSRGRVPIALLSTQIANGDLDDVDATSTDLTTLKLNGIDVDAVHAAFEDIDRDGDDDLILHFRVPDLIDRGVLDAESVDLVLAAEFGRGEMSGTELRGSDTVRTKHPGKGKGKR